MTVRRMIAGVLARWRPRAPLRYAAITQGEAQALAAAWQAPAIPAAQAQVVERQLEELRTGATPRVFQVAVEAVTGVGIPVSMLDVGCSTGYYAAVFRELCGDRVTAYLGLDYSGPMVVYGKRRHPFASFVAGDATSLPFQPQSWDVVLLGGVLLHLSDPDQALREAARVARRAVVVHRQPVFRQRPTGHFRKLAYGQTMMEVIFREQDLLDRVHQSGLSVERTWELETTEVDQVTEPATTMTYLCRVRP